MLSQNCINSLRKDQTIKRIAIEQNVKKFLIIELIFT